MAKTYSERFWIKVDKHGPLSPLGSPCWDWRGPGHGGYGRFSIRSEGRKRYVYAHRFAWEDANGPLPEGKIVRHKCDRSSCVNPEHLIPGTRRENIQDAIDRGRFRPSLGEWQPGAKLTEIKVLDIRERRALGAPLSELAFEHGVTVTTISSICRGHLWAHVGGPVLRPLEINASRKASVEDERRVCALYRAGRSLETIAIQEGFTAAGIHAIVVRNKVLRRRIGHPSKTTLPQRAKIRAMYARGRLSMREIGELFGLSAGVIFRVIHHTYFDD